MTEEFPSNSHRDRETSARPKGAAEPQEKKIKRVTTSEPVRRKPPLGKRFKETFFGGGDAKGVFGYVLGEVLVPAAKDMVADATTQAVERAVFGESRPRSRRPGGYTSYNTAYRPQNGGTPPWRQDKPQNSPREMSRQGRSQHAFDEIVLDSRGEAELVLESLFDLIQQYTVATVADLYQLVGITSAYTDQKYGWSDLRGARVEHVRGGGYLLNLPRPNPLD